MKSRGLAAVLALLLAAGCGSGNGDNMPAANNAPAPAPTNEQAVTNSGNAAANGQTANDGNAADGTQATNEGSAADGGAAEGTPANAGEGSGAPAGTANTGSNAGSGDAEALPDAPAKAEPLYRMSKAYRFQPIAETTPKKVVLLTFDDGPKAKETVTSLLDTLDKHKAKAIFFVNGYRVKENPELLTLIHDRGQTIGNHSWDHIDLKKEPEASVHKQVGDVSDLVEKLTGERPVFFRPPFGSGGDAVKQYVSDQGMLYMTWSDGSLDWDLKATKKDPALVIQNVLEQIHDGANILMHELEWTTEALDQLLTRLEEKGYGFIDPSTIEHPAPEHAE